MSYLRNDLRARRAQRGPKFGHAARAQKPERAARAPKQPVLVTDASHADGVMGWAVLVYGMPGVKGRKEFSGACRGPHDPLIGEAWAMIHGLDQLPGDGDVLIITDREDLRNFPPRAEQYRNNGWCQEDGTPISHREVWMELARACSRHRQVTVKWVKGHGDDLCNARVDLLANLARLLFGAWEGPSENEALDGYCGAADRSHRSPVKVSRPATEDVVNDLIRRHKSGLRAIKLLEGELLKDLNAFGAPRPDDDLASDRVIAAIPTRPREGSDGAVVEVIEPGNGDTLEPVI